MGLFDFLKRKRTPKEPPELQAMLQMMSSTLFPGGKEQIEQEAGVLHSLLGERLNLDETMRLLARTKSLLSIAQDKSQERLVASIVASTNNRLTPHEATLVWQFCTGSTEGASASDGEGSTGDPVVINATSFLAGAHAEYQWIERKYGTMNKDWTIEERSHGVSDEGRHYEKFHIKLADGTPKTIVFDISSFYGKF